MRIAQTIFHKLLFAFLFFFSFSIFYLGLKMSAGATLSTTERALVCSQHFAFNEGDVQNLRKSADNDGIWTKMREDPVLEEIRAAFATNSSKIESDKARLASAEKWKQAGDAIYGQWLAGDRQARQKPKQRLDSSAQARRLKQALHAYTEVDPQQAPAANQ
jgi:hypothetical protein